MKNKESLRPTHPGSPIRGASHLRRQGPQSKFPPIERLAATKGRANVLLILLDDVGFAAPCTFCGVLPTPLDRVAAGLRDTNFHSTSLC